MSGGYQYLRPTDTCYRVHGTASNSEAHCDKQMKWCQGDSGGRIWTTSILNIPMVRGHIRVVLPVTFLAAVDCSVSTVYAFNQFINKTSCVVREQVHKKLYPDYIHMRW